MVDKQNRKSKKGYYDFDISIEEVLTGDGMIEDYFYLQDLRQRKLILNFDVDQVNISELVKHILQFNTDDMGKNVEDRMPIRLYIASNGGEVDAGFELIDVIMASKTPVYTINLANAYSMGFLILLAGHKRFAMKNAKCLMHDGSNFVYNSGAKAQDQMEFNKRNEQRIKEYILSRSNITEEDYENKLRVEWYLFADEAKEKGFIDNIIGEDCDIDFII